MVLVNGIKESTPVCVFHNCLIVPSSSELLGLVLGNCVYGRKGVLKGKLINRHLYNIRGEKLAVETNAITCPPPSNIEQIRENMWQVLRIIKNHNPPWVELQERWSDSDIREFLLS